MQVIKLHGPSVARVLNTYTGTLAYLRIYVPDLILVGGAVRDVYLGRPVKDLDYMTCDDEAARVISEYYKEPIRHCLDEPVNEYEGDSNTLIDAYETVSKGVNILRVSHQLSHIAQFPDSISQVWTDGDCVYASSAFRSTGEDRVVRYTQRMTSERLGRIQAKYPDFAFEDAGDSLA